LYLAELKKGKKTQEAAMQSEVFRKIVPPISNGDVRFPSALGDNKPSKPQAAEVSNDF
jgi:hypothetical protein